MDKKQQAALNQAKFIKRETLALLERLDTLGMDERAEQCERLHELAESLLKALQLDIEVQHGSTV